VRLPRRHRSAGDQAPLFIEKLQRPNHSPAIISTCSPHGVHRVSTQCRRSHFRAAKPTRPPSRRPRNYQPPRPTLAPPTPRTPDGNQRNKEAPARHLAVRYDAFPPWTDSDIWWYYCDACGRDRITGAELRSSPIVHIAGATKPSSIGRLEVIYTQYGGGSPQ
jgi:hypothetical protein